MGLSPFSLRKASFFVTRPTSDGPMRCTDFSTTATTISAATAAAIRVAFIPLFPIRVLRISCRFERNQTSRSAQ